ncbi:lectin C-type domain protein [Oesophagostomum dentatum]|uniref:Lectin C-type domain protein n=1 Tax=Oesophagostomum dentatum TaxID=61180 RepID=A0A0B1SXG2_OESDE|nr:lectin C-type domain protein [Oesophagostomum dentatum]
MEPSVHTVITNAIFTLRTDWYSAETVCQRNGGHLISIESENENTYVKRLISGYSTETFYIGAYVSASNSKWVWTSSAANFSYSNFEGMYLSHSDIANSQASSTSSLGDFTAMLLSGEYFGEWYFSDVLVSRPFVCQVPDCSSSVKQEPVQPLDRIGYFDNDTSDYYLFGSFDKSNFYDAEVQCQRLGGHLPSISNAYENAKVQNAAAKMFGTITDNAIILGYQASDNGFSWIDGNPSTYTNWASRQPEKNKQAVAWMNLQSGFWEANSLVSMSFFMCALPTHRQSCNNLP